MLQYMLLYMYNLFFHYNAYKTCGNIVWLKNEVLVYIGVLTM